MSYKYKHTNVYLYVIVYTPKKKTYLVWGREPGEHENVGAGKNSQKSAL